MYIKPPVDPIDPEIVGGPLKRYIRRYYYFLPSQRFTNHLTNQSSLHDYDIFF